MYTNIELLLPFPYYSVKDEALEQLLDLFSQAFGGSHWSPVTMPLNEGFNHAECRLLKYHNILLCFRETFYHSRLHYPSPIVGTVMPMINFHQYLEYWARANQWLDESMKVSIWGSDPQHPILIPIISDIPHATNESMIDVEIIREIVDRLSGRRSCTVIEYPVEELSILPQVIADHFAVSIDYSSANSHNNSLPVPSLPSFSINPANMGVGKAATLGFIEDCLKTLIPQRHSFRIWIDAVKTIIHSTDDDIGSLGRKINEDILMYDGILLSKPEVKPLTGDHWSKPGHVPLLGKAWEPGQCRAEPAYHLYLEQDGLVYDGLIAFEAPVSLAEYQSKLDYTGPINIKVNDERTITLSRSQEDSTWRTSIKITPETTVDEAMQKLDDVLGRVKMGILE